MSTVSRQLASDVGLIVQGTLIFLSAIVAVLGYIIQSRLSSRAHSNNLKLAREERHKDAKLLELQNVLNTIVGPVQAYIQTGNNMLMQFGARSSKLIEGQDGKPMHGFAYFPRLLGSIQDWKDMMAGKRNGIATWLLPELVQMIQTAPNGQLAKDYRRTMESALVECFIPAADIIKKHLNQFPFPSRTTFKKKFPAYAKSAQLRKKMLMEFCDWTNNTRMILEREWKEGDYSRIHPSILYPWSILPYAILFLDELKDQISSMTDKMFNFELTSIEEEAKEMLENLKQHRNKASNENENTEQNLERNERKTSSKYLATGTVAGAAVVGVTSAVLNGGSR